MQVLDNVFPNQNVDRKIRLAAYVTTLAGIGDDDLLRAVKRAIAECQFFPPPVMLIGFAGHGSETQNTKQISERAFSILVEKIITRGRYCNFDLSDDPALALTIRRCGGISTICAKEQSELHTFFKKQFVDIYCELYNSKQTTSETIIRGIHPEKKPEKINCLVEQKTNLLTERVN